MENLSSNEANEDTHKGQSKVLSKKALVVFPTIQPTHSGYLTSATLLPY